MYCGTEREVRSKKCTGATSGPQYWFSSSSGTFPYLSIEARTLNVYYTAALRHHVLAAHDIGEHARSAQRLPEDGGVLSAARQREHEPCPEPHSCLDSSEVRSVHSLGPRAPLQSLNACSQRRWHIFFFSLRKPTGPLFLFSFPCCLRPGDTRKVVEMASRFDKSGYRADHLSELLPSELTIRLL